MVLILDTRNKNRIGFSGIPSCPNPDKPIFLGGCKFDAQNLYGIILDGFPLLAQCLGCFYQLC